jgi:hypothetical protein
MTWRYLGPPAARVGCRVGHLAVRPKDLFRTEMGITVPGRLLAMTPGIPPLQAIDSPLIETDRGDARKAITAAAWLASMCEGGGQANVTIIERLA